MADEKEWICRDNYQRNICRLKLLAKHVTLDDPEQVKEFIANQSWSPYFKNAVSYAYDKYVRANGLEWKPTIYKTPRKLPKIPTTERINLIIAETRCQSLD